MADRDRLGLVGDARRRRRRSAPARRSARPRSGSNDAEPAALDHRRAAHADARVLGGDRSTSQQPSSAALPAKQQPGDDRRPAAPARSAAPNSANARQSSAGDDRAVGVAGPPAAALGEEHDRQPHALGQLEQPVLLAVVVHALGAGEHRVVVGHRRRAGRAVDRRRRRRPARRPGCARSAPRASRRRSLGGDRAAARTRRRCPRRRGRRRSRARCAGRARGACATASGRAASRPSAWRSRTSARSSRERRRGLGAAALGARARRRRRRRARAIASSWPSVDRVADARPRRSSHHAAGLARAPRAPSSSPRARPARRRRRPARRAAWAIATTVPRTARPPRAAAGPASTRACQPSARTASRISSGEALSLASCAMCDQATVPPGATSIAPPSCAGWPSVLDCTLPVFAVAANDFATTFGPSSSPERRHLRPGGLVAGPRLVGEHGQLDPLAAAEVRRVARGQLADQHEVARRPPRTPPGRDATAPRGPCNRFSRNGAARPARRGGRATGRRAGSRDRPGRAA